MSRIKLLPETVASQVAAGEVVERPASVVKELVENSIDAGASSIEIGIQRGGISRIRVVDDGCGMDRDDALLSLERHATSKIASAADLAAISTLGFRGEALPSIASVSRFRLTTREPRAVAGTEILVNGGRIETVRDGGEAPGTQVEVRSLFYNVPARRKFLRSETTETRNIEHQFFLQALAQPAIGFSLVRDEKVALQLPVTASLRDRIRDLYGAEFLNELLEISEREHRGVRVRGWIGRAGVSRQTRAQQFVFVNGRTIDSGILATALREGYHTALMRGQAGALIGSENSARRFQQPEQYRRPRPFPSKVYRPGVRHRLNDPFRARLKSVRGVHRGNPMSLKPRRQTRLSNRPCRSRCLAVEPIPRFARSQSSRRLTLSRDLHPKTICNFKSSVCSTGFTF